MLQRLELQAQESQCAALQQQLAETEATESTLRRQLEAASASLAEAREALTLEATTQRAATADALAKAAESHGHALAACQRKAASELARRIAEAQVTIRHTQTYTPQPAPCTLTHRLPELLQNAHEEALQAAVASHTAALAQAQRAARDAEAKCAQAEAALAEQRQAHTEELTRLQAGVAAAATASRAAAEAAVLKREQAHAQRMQDAEASHSAALEAATSEARQHSAQELVEAKARIVALEQGLKHARAEVDDVTTRVQRLRVAHKLQLAGLRTRHAREIEELEREHDAKRTQVSRRHYHHHVARSVLRFFVAWRTDGGIQRSPTHGGCRPGR